MRVNSPKIIIFLLAILLLFYCLVYAQVRQPLKQRLNIVSRKLEFARELQATFHEQSPIEQLKSAELKLGRARELMQAR